MAEKADATTAPTQRVSRGPTVAIPLWPLTMGREIDVSDAGQIVNTEKWQTCPGRRHTQ